MTTNIIETLLWVDYPAIYMEMEENARSEAMAEGIAKGIEKGKAEGITVGVAERDMEIALKAFTIGLAQGKNLGDVESMLLEFDIPHITVQAARRQAESDN